MLRARLPPVFSGYGFGGASLVHGDDDRGIVVLMLDLVRERGQLSTQQGFIVEASRGDYHVSRKRPALPEVDNRQYVRGKRRIIDKREGERRTLCNALVTRHASG